MRDRLPQMMNTPELRFPCSEERKFSAVEDVKLWLEGREGLEISRVDGVRVKNPNGWWLLRASNTQDVLVARCESDTEAGLAVLKNDLAEALRAVGLDPPRF